jgi:hypothetical protein
MNYEKVKSSTSVEYGQVSLGNHDNVLSIVSVFSNIMSFIGHVMYAHVFLNFWLYYLFRSGYYLMILYCSLLGCSSSIQWGATILGP